MLMRRAATTRREERWSLGRQERPLRDTPGDTRLGLDRVVLARAVATRLFIPLLAVCVSACLPNTLSDEALHAKVADASAGKGGPLCGNTVVDPAENETCDDGNTDSCDACDKCQVRTALDCKDGKSLFGLTSLGPLQFDGQQDWSMEAWFLVRTAPLKLPAPFLVMGVPGGKADASLAFTMGVAPVGANLVTFCALEKVVKSTSIGAAVTPNTWHHLRCVWSAKDAEMRASLDGGQLAAADKKIPSKTAAGFDAGAWLLAGQLAAATSSGLQAEPFDGLLDELRAAVGPNVSTTPLVRRYGANNAETVAVYHMDPENQARFLKDSSSNHLDADQITLNNNTPIKRDAVLSFVGEACYGYSAQNAECAANPKPPWCP